MDIGLIIGGLVVLVLSKPFSKYLSVYYEDLFNIELEALVYQIGIVLLGLFLITCGFLLLFDIAKLFN